MTIGFLIFVAFLDLVLLGVIYVLYKKWLLHSQILSDITEERQLISQMHETIRSQLSQSTDKATGLLADVKKIAAEIEQEVKHSSSTIAANVDGLAKEIAAQFESPLEELASRQQVLVKLYQDVQREKETLARLLQRSEHFVRLFDKELSYDDVVKDIEQRRYEDARKLLTKGMTVEKVARELGIPTSEVRLIQGLV